MHDEPSSQTTGESTITEILQNVTFQFKTGGIASPRLDAELLLAFVLKLQRLDLYLQADRPLSTIESREMSELAKRRLDGIPVAYLLEKKEFWSLNLKIFPGVLIPRPETELLVEIALPAMIRMQEKQQGRRLRVVDYGTGTGAILLAIASELENLDFLGGDLSSQALETAAINVETHRQMLEKSKHRVFLFQGKGLESFGREQSVDVLISNPPYIRSDTIPTLSPEVNQEPRLALDGGVDGLEVFRNIFNEANESLVNGGELMLEHGNDQRNDLMELLEAYPHFGPPEYFDDLEGRPRVMKLVKQRMCIQVLSLLLQRPLWY